MNALKELNRLVNKNANDRTAILLKYIFVDNKYTVFLQIFIESPISSATPCHGRLRVNGVLIWAVI